MDKYRTILPHIYFPDFSWKPLIIRLKLNGQKLSFWVIRDFYHISNYSGLNPGIFSIPDTDILSCHQSIISTFCWRLRKRILLCAGRFHDITWEISYVSPGSTSWLDGISISFSFPRYENVQFLLKFSTEDSGISDTPAIHHTYTRKAIIIK